MSNLLIHGQPLIIVTELATEIGLSEAIVLQQVHYWIQRSNHIKKGYHWIYNSYDDWQDQFPFWSRNTIIRTIKRLEDSGLLISDNFNEMKMDKTKWYRIDYKLLNSLDKSSTQNEYIQLSNLSKQHVPNLGKAIPENTHKITTENKKNIKKETDLAAFQQFWTIYPKKVDKKKAEKSFSSVTKLYPIEDILAGTKRYVQQLEKMRTERQYIKHPSTFLNNHSFLNDYEGANDEINKRKYSEEYNLPF